MKKMSFDLENKNILITGGNGFLGSQISEELLNEKANVYIIDINNPKKKTSAKNFNIFQIKKNKNWCFNK